MDPGKIRVRSNEYPRQNPGGYRRGLNMHLKRIVDRSAMHIVWIQYGTWFDGKWIPFGSLMVPEWLQYGSSTDFQ